MSDYAPGPWEPVPDILAQGDLFKCMRPAGDFYGDACAIWHRSKAASERHSQRLNRKEARKVTAKRKGKR